MANSTPGETFRDRLDNIQKQIDSMGKQISNAISIAKTAENIVARVSTLEEETQLTSNARRIPDSEGFWRDIDGDIWVRDVVGTTRLISKGYKQDDNEIYDQSLHFSTNGSEPFVKIDNPFIQGEDHAE